MGKQYLKYDTNRLAIEQVLFDSNLTAKSESIMALGNGYLGLRSVDEEVESFNKEDLFVNGVFNKDSTDEVTEIANLADLVQTPIFLNGERLTLTSNDGYNKHLALRNGELTRTINIKRQGRHYQITFVRFVSQFNKHLYLQKIEIRQTRGLRTLLTILPRINGQTTNYGTQHFKEGLKHRTSLTSLQYLEETTLSRRFVAHNLVVNTFVNNQKLEGGTDDFIVTMDRRQLGFKINTSIASNEIFTMEKLMTVNTSVDKEQETFSKAVVQSRARELYEQIKNTSYKDELAKSNQVWDKVWQQFNVQIKGESLDAKYDRLAFTFAVFHLNSFVPKSNSNLSIGAKGLSGEGYQGHCFWDTELFINPSYLFTKPEIVKNLLTYRYKGLQGARDKAQEKKLRQAESHLNGAQYPWEMAWPSDGEVCPYWGQVDVVTGKQVPIASRRQEIHVSAAIAYAVNQYYIATGDSNFMAKMGYEMIIDTAIFWTQRAEKQDDGSYAIKDVMGPNEYKGNIDNNAYTNAMAAYNIELALQYISILKTTKQGQKLLATINQKIPYPYDLNHFHNVLANLKQQAPNHLGVIPENDQFLALKRVDVRPFQLRGDAGKKLFATEEGHKRLSSQLVKQADVVLLTYLFPERYAKAVIKANFDFYEPVTTHDSSLSPTTYAIQAIELRKMKLAYKLFKYSLNIDLGLNMISSDKGIHAGALAAVWQSVVFGYGGMRYVNDGIGFNPVLPAAWDELEYNALFQKAWINVVLKRETFQLKTLNDQKVRVLVNGDKVEISSKPQEFKVKNGY